MSLKTIIKEIKNETGVIKVKDLITGCLYKNSDDKYIINHNTPITQIYNDLKSNYTYIPF